MFSTRILVLVTLSVGLAHSFSWEIVVGIDKQLNFYNNGTLTHTEYIPFAYDIVAITYDPVRNRLFFVDQQNIFSSTNIYSFDIATKKTQPLVSNLEFVTYLAYDPATESLFWSEEYGLRINSFSLKHESNQIGRRNLIIVNNVVHDIAVDSCGGYVYWLTDEEIERARFDGSEREVFIDFNNTDQTRISLAIDHETQKIYWSEYVGDWMERAERGEKTDTQMKSVDLNTTNRRILHVKIHKGYIKALTISKNFIYWKDYATGAIWQLPSNIGNVEPKLYLHFNGPDLWDCNNVAANYTINVCSFNKEDDQADYESQRADVSICKNYCLQGNCSVGTEGQPICRCDAGFSGERCEVDACQKHCLNNGVCSLNDEGEPVCQCTSDYEGERCYVQSQSRNETVGQSCAHSPDSLPDLSEIGDDDASSKFPDRQFKDRESLDLLTVLNDFRAEMNVILSDFKNSTATLLAEHKTLNEKISELQKDCTNTESKTETVLVGPVEWPDEV